MRWGGEKREGTLDVLERIISSDVIIQSIINTLIFEVIGVQLEGGA